MRKSSRPVARRHPPARVRQAGCREPRHLDAGARLSARHDRSLRRERLRAYWREIRRTSVLVTTAGRGVRKRFSGSSGTRETVRSSSPIRRSRRPRSSSPASSDAVSDRHRPRQLLRPGRVRGRPARSAQPGRGEKLIDFLLSPQLSGRRAPVDVRLPCAPGVAAARGVHEVRARGATPARPAGQAIGANRDRWIREWTDTVPR